MRVLITGASGQLGKDCVSEFGNRDEVVAMSRTDLDVVDREAVLAALEYHRPEVVINCAAWTAVDECESDPDKAFRINAMGARNIAEATTRLGGYLLHISTDYVFDGTKAEPYLEWDEPNPTSVYGASKLGGEREVQAMGGTIVRTSWVCSAHGGNMVETVLRLCDEDPKRTLRFVDDQRGCPTFTPELAKALREIAVRRLPGVFHVTNEGSTTWFEFAAEIAAQAGFTEVVVEPIKTADLNPPRPAPRPANSVIANTAFSSVGLELLPDWRESLTVALTSLGRR